MTNEEKNEMRQQMSNTADCIIKALETVESKLPKDISEKDRNIFLSNIIQQTSNIMKATTEQFAKQMTEVKNVRL